MTATERDPPLAAMRPKLRSDVVLGPALRRGNRIVHHVKDRRAGAFYQLGPREYFVLCRLDGERTLADIGAEYATRYGRRLAAPHWTQLLMLLGSRQLLTDAPASPPPALSTTAAAPRPRSLMYARLPLACPDRFLGTVAQRLRGLFTPATVIVTILVATAVESYSLTRFSLLVEESLNLWHHRPVLVLFVIAFVVGGVAVHELAHGLTCKHFGGTVPEIGLMWRFPVLAAYCQVDDIYLFHNRWHRVYTAFAGILANLVLLAPVLVIHVCTPDGSPVHLVAAGILLTGAASATTNLLPLFQLDGYFVVNHAMNMIDLRQEALRYCKAALRATIGMANNTDLAGYDRRTKQIYLTFQMASVIGSAAIIVSIALWAIDSYL